MRSIATAILAALIGLPALADAYVTERTREAKLSAEDEHTVHVPASGPVQSVTVTGEAARIEAWLRGYDDAFNAKDLEKLGSFYHPEVTIYEGGGVDRGWAAYRDGHLGPELKAFENLQFGHSERQIHLLGDRSAYVASTYFLKAKMGERSIDSSGLETLVLTKGDDGIWRIRHSHTSARPRRPAEGDNRD